MVAALPSGPCLPSSSAYQRRLMERPQPWLPSSHPAASLDFPASPLPTVPLPILLFFVGLLPLSSSFLLPSLPSWPEFLNLSPSLLLFPFLPPTLSLFNLSLSHKALHDPNSPDQGVALALLVFNSLCQLGPDFRIFVFCGTL